MNRTDIAGYLFCGEAFCPSCIHRLFTLFDLNGGSGRTTEDMLDQVAAKLGIRRHDVTSFSAYKFPKPIYMRKVSGGHVCALCDRSLNSLSEPA